MIKGHRMTEALSQSATFLGPVPESETVEARRTIADRQEDMKSCCRIHKLRHSDYHDDEQRRLLLCRCP